MNKKVVNESIPLAYKALDDAGIVSVDKENRKIIDKKYRGQISSFGAAITMGSLLSAVAFFSNKGSSDVDRDKILDAIFRVLKEQGKTKQQDKLYEYINEKLFKDHIQENVVKDEIINITIAVKLAMNLYILES